MEQEHFEELRVAHHRVREQDHKVYQLRDHIQTQAEQMAKFEAMRPRNKRLAELQAIFAGV